MSAMPRPWMVRLREAWIDLRKAASVRAERERTIPAEFEGRSVRAEQEFAAAKRAAEEEFRAKQAEAEADAEREQQEIQDDIARRATQTQAEYRRVRNENVAHYRRQRDEAENDFKEARWAITTIFEADKKVARDQYRQSQLDSQALLKQLEQHDLEAVAILARWELLAPDESLAPPAPAAEGLNPWADLQEAMERSKGELDRLRRLRLPRWINGVRPFFLTLALWGILATPLILLEQPWFASASVLAGLVAVGWFVRRQIHRSLAVWALERRQALREAASHAASHRHWFLEQARTQHRERRKQAAERTQASIREAVARTKALVKDLRKQRSARFEDAERTYPPRLKELQAERERRLQESADAYRRTMVRLHAVRDEKLHQSGKKFRHDRETANRQHAEAFTRMLRDWKDACDRLDLQRQAVAKAAAAWFGPEPPPEGLPAGIPFGTLRLDLRTIPDGLPGDRFLPVPAWHDAPAPACLAFPERASLLLENSEAQRARGVDLLKAMLLGAWRALPPGRMRCTLIDPVGRGEHFAGFMHLADHDPQLIDHRIWTETAHIEEQLSELTAHMETILQKFLRNQFGTLAEYNAQAGELAEPFRFVAVADFPANFSKEAAARLLSLASAGARAGIYVWVQADPTKEPPEGLRWDDLEAACTVLHAGTDTWLWQDVDFATLPLAALPAPSEAELSRQLHDVGKQAVAAGRVQVPFGSIAPTNAELWSQESSQGLSVPLGKIGAGRPQLLSLGQGTQQHVLVAGKTGSGKSTLLHVLILQLGLRYSPDEVELYLIDFKKGVEFKTYAVHAMPHARVVAVESEREFGLSVLQSLDAELARRGERFREAGVHDLAAYRASAAGKNVRMPRIVFIVDEFQEFFVEDDKLAQEASLLLDRLVRQGRAFGMHVVLGSQTLGGAYGLARATLDQMAIRIALPCSEADAHLILSRENTEARLLSRPGEAIYNNAGGLLEGNQFFQAVWIDDGLRDQHLERLHRLAAEKKVRRAAPLAVFEGNRPAELASNPRLAAATGDFAGPTAWLGESLTLRDPPSLKFARHSGSNLLIVGQQEERAFDVLFAAMLGLRRSAPNAEIAFVPGQPIDPVRQKALEQFAAAADVRLVGASRVAELVAKWSGDLAARAQEDGKAAPRFLVLHGLHRLRELRRPDDDLGIARRGEENLPHRVFARLLREGPPAGTFLLAWCDNLANLQRSLDRASIREFEMKVAFAMNPSDSSQYLDSPLASKLGTNRAFLYREDQGLLEKFRPYGLPESEWLEKILL